MERVSIGIEGMSCGGCVRKVREALSRVVGVQIDDVRVGAADLTLDTKRTSVEAARAAISGAGFRPVVA